MQRGKLLVRFEALIYVVVAVFAATPNVMPVYADGSRTLIVAPDRPQAWPADSPAQLWPTDPCPGGDCPELKGGWLV
ncbi:hypothetical protein [Flindersiella endophytica]